MRVVAHVTQRAHARERGEKGPARADGRGALGPRGLLGRLGAESLAHLPLQSKSERPCEGHDRASERDHSGHRVRLGAGVRELCAPRGPGDTL